MSGSNINTKSQKSHHLNAEDKIEVLLKMKIPKAEVARQVGTSRSTLHEEIKCSTVRKAERFLKFPTSLYKGAYEKKSVNSLLW